MQGTELSQQVPRAEAYIGIDVCKSHLDIHIHLWRNLPRR